MCVIVIRILHGTVLMAPTGLCDSLVCNLKAKNNVYNGVTIQCLRLSVPTSVLKVKLLKLFFGV